MNAFQTHTLNIMIVVRAKVVILDSTTFIIFLLSPDEMKEKNQGDTSVCISCGANLPVSVT